MQDKVLVRYGVVDILRIEHDKIRLTLAGKIIIVPHERFKGSNGVWGTAYDLTNAFYETDHTRLSAETRAVLQENIRLGHHETPCMFE